MIKSISNKNKIILSVIIIFIICGIITLLTNGFEKTSEYKAGTRIEVYIPQGCEKEDIVNIANGSFNGKAFEIEKIEKLDQIVGIRIEEYTEEEIKDFKAKISEKYAIKEDKLEIYEIKLPTTRVRTIVEPYVFPITLVTVLSLIYVLFTNLKADDKFMKILKVLLTLVLVLGLYFSLIVVCKLPFGIYTMPLALVIYIVTLIIEINNVRK